VGKLLGNGLISEEQFAMARSLNTQINNLESRNNAPVVSSRPLRIGLDISSACNIKCIFCLAEKGRMRASDHGAFRKPELLDHYEPLLPFVQQVIFSSYEAILNPWFDQFVDRLRSYATPFQIFSNGYAFTPELSEYLLRNGLKSVWCSFHGASEKVYQSIMRGSDYDTVLQNLVKIKVLARKYNPSFELTLVFCAMRRTIEELSQYVDLARRVGAKKIQVNYLLVTQQDAALEQESVFFHKDLYDYHVLKAKLKAAEFGITLNHQPTFCDYKHTPTPSPCYRPWEHLNVGRTGLVQVCCGGSPALGNMFEQGFSALWNSEKIVEFRARLNSGNPPEACTRCTRDRENPYDPTVHLTYLRLLSQEEQFRHLERLGIP